MSRDDLVQQIIDEREDADGKSAPVIRYALAIEVLEEGDEHPSVLTFYSENMSPWSIKGLSWLLGKDADASASY